MSDDIGALGGNDTGGPNGETYYIAVQARHYGADDVAYDSIEEDSKNRWHLQAYFETPPESDTDGDGVGEFAYNSRYVNYRIENGVNDQETDFEDWTPNESMMDNGGDFSLGPFTVLDAFTKTPYLTAGLAFVEFLLSGAQGDVSWQDYRYVDWHIPLDGSQPLPTSQGSDSNDASSGVKVDVENYAPPSDDYEPVVAKSEYCYDQVDAYGYTTFITNEATTQVSYDPVAFD